MTAIVHHILNYSIAFYNTRALARHLESTEGGRKWRRYDSFDAEAVRVEEKKLGQKL